MTASKALLACSALLLLSTVARAQQPGTTYDVISIHPNHSLSGSTRISTETDRLNFTNVTLKQMLTWAYGIREGLIDGLPSWAESAHFDVTAKVVDPDLAALNAMTRKERAAMFIPVLADRFSVKVHTETKTLPIYDLVLTKDGPKFKEYVPPAGDPPSKGPNMGAGVINSHMSAAGMDLTASGVPMTSLAEWLSGRVDKTVVDNTGLTGKYDFGLRFTPDNARMNGAPVEPTDAAPDIYTALQEQLGLKLVAGKGPVVTLVVDQVKQPTEN
jgi:uncharacterized protein (TIGR03435 family)